MRGKFLQGRPRRNMANSLSVCTDFCVCVVRQHHNLTNLFTLLQDKWWFIEHASKRITITWRVGLWATRHARYLSNTDYPSACRTFTRLSGLNEYLYVNVAVMGKSQNLWLKSQIFWDEDLNHVAKTQISNSNFLWNLKSSKSKYQIISQIFIDNAMPNFSTCRNTDTIPVLILLPLLLIPCSIYFSHFCSSMFETEV